MDSLGDPNAPDGDIGWEPRRSSRINVRQQYHDDINDDMLLAMEYPELFSEDFDIGLLDEKDKVAMNASKMSEVPNKLSANSASHLSSQCHPHPRSPPRFPAASSGPSTRLFTSASGSSSYQAICDEIARAYDSRSSNSVSQLQLFGQIAQVSSASELCLSQRIELKAPVLALAVHPSGIIMACATVLGDIHLFQLADDKWAPFSTFRASVDSQYVDEIFCLAFSPDGALLFAAGARKHRSIFDQRDSDLKVLPSPVFVFDLLASEDNSWRYEWPGHSEEVLRLVPISFKTRNYLVSCGQDGYVLKWHLGSSENGHWQPTLIGSPKRFADSSTWLAFDVAFLPHMGNKYFMLAGDEGLKLFDFESEIVIAAWPQLYAVTCDNVIFLEAEEPLQSGWHLITHGTDGAGDADSMDEEDSLRAEAGLSRPVAVHLRKLLPPNAATGSPPPVNNGWAMQLVRSFEHNRQTTNSWPLRLSATSHTLFVPTCHGKVIIWDMQSGTLAGSLADHMQAKGAIFRGGGGGTIREVVTHNSQPFLITAGEDGDVCIYRAATTVGESHSNISGSLTVSQHGMKRSLNPYPFPRCLDSRRSITRLRQISTQVASVPAPPLKSSKSSSPNKRPRGRPRKQPLSVPSEVSSVVSAATSSPFPVLSTSSTPAQDPPFSVANDASHQLSTSADDKYLEMISSMSSDEVVRLERLVQQRKKQLSSNNI